MCTSRDKKYLKQPHLIPQATREKTKPKAGRRKETTKITVEIKMKETEKINEIKKCFFEGMIQIDKPLARIPEKKGTEIESEITEMLQWTPQNYKERHETTRNDHMPTNLTTYKNGYIPKNTTFQTDSQIRDLNRSDLLLLRRLSQ